MGVTGTADALHSFRARSPFLAGYTLARWAASLVPIMTAMTLGLRPAGPSPSLSRHSRCTAWSPQMAKMPALQGRQRGSGAGCGAYNVRLGHLERDASCTLVTHAACFVGRSRQTLGIPRNACRAGPARHLTASLRMPGSSLPCWRHMRGTSQPPGTRLQGRVAPEP